MSRAGILVALELCVVFSSFCSHSLTCWLQLLCLHSYKTTELYPPFRPPVLQCSVLDASLSSSRLTSKIRTYVKVKQVLCIDYALPWEIHSSLLNLQSMCSSALDGRTSMGRAKFYTISKMTNVKRGQHKQ